MGKYWFAGMGLVCVGLVAVSFVQADDDVAAGGGQAARQVVVTTQSRPAGFLRTLVPDWQALTTAQIQAAITASKELVDKAEEPSETLAQAVRTLAMEEIYLNTLGGRGKEGATRPLPRRGHVDEYLAARPWVWNYKDWLGDRGINRRSAERPTSFEPRLECAPFLREMLSNKDADIRAMAAEALATLHQPEDAALLGALLDDDAAAPPFLSHRHSMLASFFDDNVMQIVESSDLNVYRVWRQETVAQCARRALLLMTGVQFDTREGFDKWWEVNSGGRNCLWYWQRRVDRECDWSELPEVRWRPDDTYETFTARRQALHDAAKAAANRAILAELRKLDPEVEAKVRLLAEASRYPHNPFWIDPPNLRVPASRLLDLLDRKGLWSDVSWDTWDSPYYHLLVDQLGTWAHVLFTAEDAPRLLVVAQREGHKDDGTMRSRVGSLVIGISRLFPPAVTVDALDDLDTRDGVLRQAVRDDGYPPWTVRRPCAMELARVGLPENGPFLKEVAFATKGDETNQFCAGILQVLAEPPITPTQREFLVEILLDKRFDPFWVRPDRQGTLVGFDTCRRKAFRAIDAHLGRRALDWPDLERRMVESRTAADRDKAVAEIHDIVKGLREPATKPL